MTHSLAPTMAYLSQRALRLGIDLAFEIYCTVPSQPPLDDLPSCVTSHLSRPNLSGLVSAQLSPYSITPSVEAPALSAALSAHGKLGHGVAVIACGPESLVQEARGIVAGLSLRDKTRSGGVAFHGETYAL